MDQNTAEKRVHLNLQDQLSLLENFSGTLPVKSSIQPIFQVNDGLVDRVIPASAERSSSGTTTIFTADAAPKKVWITGFTISLSSINSVLA